MLHCVLFTRIVGFLFLVQLLNFYYLDYTKWAADGFKTLADLSCFEQRGPGDSCTGCVGGKPESRQKPAKWSSAARGQHWSHLAELMPVPVCHGLAALMLSSFRGLSFCFVELLGSSAAHHTALQCLCPLQICHSDGESCVMEEFKLGHELHSIYSWQSGLINFEVWKQKLKGSCQGPQNMEGWMLFSSGPEF